MKRVYLFLIILTFTLSLRAQIAPGKWNLQMAMTHTTQVVEAGRKIFFLSDGGVYVFNKEDNSLEVLNKITGLTGSDFSEISYNETTKSIVIAYGDGTIDVIRENGKIYPMFDIKRKNISGNKEIFNIGNYNEYCYLGCSFGIVVLNLEKLEIKDSYIIGEGGNYAPVFDVAVVDNFIFAGTETGIMYAPLEGVNLLDYSVWQKVENIFLQDFSYNNFEIGWNRLWVVHNSDTWHGDKTYSRHAADIWYPELEEQQVINDLKIGNGYAVYAAASPNVDANGTLFSNPYIQVYNEQRASVVKITSYPFASSEVGIKPKSAIVDKEGILWIADENYGGIKYENGNFTQLTPEGPYNNNVISLTYENGVLWTASGGRNEQWGNMDFDFNINRYSNGKWDSYNKYTGAVDGLFKDAVQVVPSPNDPNKVYVATVGYGILEFENGVLQNVYNDDNSTLENIIPGYYVRIGGIDFDSQGNLWASNSEVAFNLHKMTPEGKWTHYSLPEVANERDMGPVMVTSNDDIWVIVPRNMAYGIYAMSNDGTQKKHLNVTSFFTNGTENKITAMNDVYSFVQDMEGAIWVGTSTGIAVYDQPENVFSESPFYATQPGLDKNDGYYHALLENIVVTAIAVDGGNRKWCGTKSNGLFLISADGTEEIEHFTTENSQLISDNINSLAYDGTTGILYIGTSEGIITYRTDANDASDTFSNVYAYPNPVRENYTGNIYITGLVYDTNVKITTVSGRLVYETNSEGGQAVWDGNDLAGNRVHTGVYLAYCASPDGTESVVTKILFIR